MGTRATVHFQHIGASCPEAIIYRHTDGDPEGLGIDIKLFLEEVRESLNDTRLGDPSYLAAKFVVWSADHTRQYGFGAKEDVKKPHALDFLSIGIARRDPSDIDFMYVVEGGEVEAYKVISPITGLVEKVDIPEPDGAPIISRPKKVTYYYHTIEEG